MHRSSACTLRLSIPYMLQALPLGSTTGQLRFAEVKYGQAMAWLARKHNSSGNTSS